MQTFSWRKIWKKKKIIRGKENIKKNESTIWDLWKGDWSRYDLRLNVDKRQDDKIYLKLQWDINDADEVQDITAARAPMEKKLPVCVTCNQSLALTCEFKQSYQGKAFWTLVKLLWHFFFWNWKEVENHIFEACKPISSECTSKYEVKNYDGNIGFEKE